MNNLADPTILCFVVGLTAGLLKSDLRLPKSSYEFVSLYLLLAIGFKGGIQLAKTDVATFLPSLLGTFLGTAIPFIAYGVLQLSKV